MPVALACVNCCLRALKFLTYLLQYECTGHRHAGPKFCNVNIYDQLKAFQEKHQIRRSQSSTRRVGTYVSELHSLTKHADMRRGSGEITAGAIGLQAEPFPATRDCPLMVWNKYRYKSAMQRITQVFFVCFWIVDIL